jgi:hypothetical protein
VIAYLSAGILGYQLAFGVLLLLGAHQLCAEPARELRRVLT